MARISTKEREAWEKKLKGGKVKMFNDDLYRMVTGFYYPRTYEKLLENPTKGGDAKLNDFYIIRAKE